jgi:hypothetical protein
MNQNIKAELDRALELEVEWTKKMESGQCGDCGSYCESMCRQYSMATIIRRLYRELHDALLDYGRNY